MAGLPKWSDEYSVHNEAIDEQHKMLFELAHKAYGLTNKQVPLDNIKDTLIGFFNYMKTHFKDEERYMESIGYPRLEAHKDIHRNIIQEMAGMVKNVHSVDVIKEMLSIIAKDWLLVHILQEDMQIEEYRKKAQEDGILKPETYYHYICSCKDKDYKFTEAMHTFISNSSQPIRCKKCHCVITLVES